MVLDLEHAFSSETHLPQLKSNKKGIIPKKRMLCETKAPSQLTERSTSAPTYVHYKLADSKILAPKPGMVSVLHIRAIKQVSVPFPEKYFFVPDMVGLENITFPPSFIGESSCR